MVLILLVSRQGSEERALSAHCSNTAVSCSVSTTHAEYSPPSRLRSGTPRWVQSLKCVAESATLRRLRLCGFKYCHYQAQGSSTFAPRPSSAAKMTSQSAVIFWKTLRQLRSAWVIPGGQRSGGSDWSSSRPRNSQLSFSRMEEGASLTDNRSFERIKRDLVFNTVAVLLLFGGGVLVLTCGVPLPAQCYGGGRVWGR